MTNDKTKDLGSSPCDKCGHPVPPDNDATIIQDIKTGGRTMIGLPQARHFLPVPGVCEGSPSRAQYIEDQPHDSRFPYDSEQEHSWRAAHKKAKRRYGKQSQ